MTGGVSAAFTGGPWTVSEYPEGAIYEIGGPRGELIAGADFGDEPLVGADEAQANAHLIAAAPDLYEALTEARAALWAIEDSAVEAGFDKLGDIIADRLTKANAALAKARGEQ